MASGSLGRTGYGSQAFDFSSDDILGSHDDFANQETSNGNHADPLIRSNSGKDFRAGRMGRSALSNVYSEESFNQEVISTVEKTMKKYADNLLRFLEGISGRLAQLELYCYNLERSIGEMRSDLVHSHSEADLKLRSLEKHLQEVHRSVQIMRDKQELAETQKELAKLHHVQKESSITSHSQHNGEVAAPSPSDSKKTDSTADIQNPQLALALPHQVPVPPSLPTRPVEQHQAAPSRTTPQNVHAQTQPQPYYSSENQLPNLPAQTQHHPQDQYLHADPQYQRAQVQDLSRQAPQQPLPPPTQVNQTQQTHPFPQYQQQWTQQFPLPIQPPQQPSPQPQIRPQTTAVYPPYPPTQPANPSPDTFPGSMPMQVPFSGIPQSRASRSESMAYGYGGGASRTTLQQQPPPQHNMQQQPQTQTNQGTFGAHLGDGVGAYPGAGQGYMIYDSEGGKAPHQPPPHFPQGGYPPTHMSSLQNMHSTTGSGHLVRHPSPSQLMRSHPYSELIEKAVSMGYGREHVASVIQRMEESGQPVDFNVVLDRLNVHSSGGSQRGWSG